MPVPATERLQPWLGSIGLHVLLVLAVATAAFNWRDTPPPPQQLAIEGSVVRYQDLPASVRSGRPLREPPAEQPAPVPPPRVEPEPQPVAPTPEQQAPPPEPAPAEPDRREAERAAQREQQVKAQQEQEARVRSEADRKAAEARKADEQRKLAEQREAALKRKAEDQARQAREQEEARSKAAAAAEARQKAARESELQRALAMEEEGEAFARSGVVDEYRAVLVQTIERNWIKPPSARTGLECTLYVTQAAGGTVLDVKLGACNGDAAVRESVANAVYRSSPLPAPRDPRAFQRQLVIVFKPTE